MKSYDYIIAGTGASGLMLAYAMANDAFFKDKRILLLDKEKKQANDRTWCFWEQGKGVWDEVVTKEWNTILVAGKNFSQSLAIAPYTYKFIRSKSFYVYIYEKLKVAPNIEITNGVILAINDQEKSVVVKTNNVTYQAQKVFTSILPDFEYKKQDKYPVLQQHFIGWYIKVDKPSFDDQVATFMDFSVAQQGNTRFMYVLPISSTLALFEYTLFSEKLLSKAAYEEAIAEYLSKKGITTYKIIEIEQGSIPMTSYPFSDKNTKNVLHIGTAGGWTKASTGFTFKNSSRKVSALVSFLKHTQDLTKFDKKNRFWWYDLLLLDVLARHNDKGALLFTKLFKANKATRILQFLDEKTNIYQELKIMSSMPPLLFIKAMIRRANKIF
ncbi:lycopene cyclase family protein [Aquimarina sp. 2-A2]|uniref:lycopene cyclase family protein n=1 Tax=Aquimarina sp. 2-A2 TaxID=3382644 RepID=UPI00387EF5C8